MTKRIPVLMEVLAVVVAMILLGTVPALGARPGERKTHKTHELKTHEKGARAGDRDGDADSDPGTRYTEDNDSGDGDTPNNVSDEGDNAHPSGKDRSVENGNSGNQGNSESAPDEDGHGPERDFGGTDKPNGPGGVDTADQDGNNGCGNDDDFEDDNEGWCGQKPKKEKVEGEDDVATPETCAVEDEMESGDETCGEAIPSDETDVCSAEDEMESGDETCGEDVTAPEDVTTPDEVEGASEEAGPTPDDVLGLVIKRAGTASPQVKADLVAEAAGKMLGERAALPFTGGEIVPLLLVGLGLVLLGLAAMHLRRGER